MAVKNALSAVARLVVVTALIGVGLLLIEACDDSLPVGVDFDQPSLDIQGAAHLGGNTGFFFLPPLVPDPDYDGIFDPTLMPVVQICEWDGAACVLPLIAEFTMTTGPKKERVKVDVDDEHYHVNWHTKKAGLDPAVTYRIRVLVAETELGFADLDVVKKGKELKNVDTEQYIALKDGRTLPIKFRIELGAVYVVDAVAATVTAADGKVTLDVPAGAVGRPTGLTVIPASGYQLPNYIVPGTAFDFGPDGQTFDVPVTLTIAYDEAQLDGKNENLLRIHKLVGDTWEVVSGGTVDPSANTVTAEITGFSDYGAGEITPPASELAFRSDRDGNWEVYTMQGDGSGQTNRTNDPAFDSRPSWSPDGRYLAFSSDREEGNFSIYVMNADGTWITRLTNELGVDSRPVWSPDGTKIAFHTNRDDGNWEIYVMDVDGSNQTNITNDPSVDAFPAWSPDGTKIAFHTNRDDGNWEIYTMDVDGSDPTNVTNHPHADNYPAWTPTGQIGFSSWRDGYGEGEIYVMDADGTGQTRLTHNVSNDWFAVWSPDGAHIAFATDRDGPYEVDDIWVMNADGTQPWNLTNAPESQETAPWWRPPLGPVAVQRVEVTPAGATVTTATQEFTAQAYDVVGNPVSGAATWTSLNPSVATVDQSGVASGVMSGQVPIAAEIDGAVGYGLLTVIKPEPAPVTIWAPVPSPVAGDLTSLWAAAPDDVWAVGCPNTKLHFDGSDWELVDGGEVCPYHWSDFGVLWGTGPDDIWSVGKNPPILHYNGTAWNEFTDHPSVDQVTGVWGAAPNDVWAVGRDGLILHYDGAAWSTFSSPVEAGTHLVALWGSAANNIWAVAHSGVGNPGTIIHYDGSEWTIDATTPSGLAWIWGTSESEKWAVGFDGLIIYVGHGGWWEQVDTPTSEHLIGVWGTVERDTWAVGANGTLLKLGTESKWSVVRSPTTETLFSVWGAGDVWAVGNNGTILRGYRGATVEITSGDITLESGKSTTLSADVLDANSDPITGASLEWTSSDPSVVSLTVDGGVTLTAGTPGQAFVSVIASPGAADFITVTVPEAPAMLAFTVQPTTTRAGEILTPAVEVAIQDALGNTVTTATNAITLHMSGGLGWLWGDTVVAAVNGVATFSTLSVHIPGDYTLLAYGVIGVSQATSAPFTVTEDAPGEVDWRDRYGHNWVTPAKNVGACGSCWAFSVTAAVKSRMMIKANDPTLQPDLSEQQIMDCTPGDGCHGGYFETALDYLRDYGVVSEEEYPYVGTDGVCTISGGSTRITGYEFRSFDPQAVRQELADHGPVPTYVYHYQDIFEYQEGVYTRTSNDYVGMSTYLLVGYSDSGQYWIAQNVWGTWWGEGGYIRVSYQNNSDLWGMWMIQVP